MPASTLSPPPCLLVIFGASGDLTKRLLIPAIYNLACDGLLPEKFAVLGFALDDLTTEQFRTRLDEAIVQFHTQKKFDPATWSQLHDRLHYMPGKFDDPEAFRRLGELLQQLDAQYQTGGNVVFYCAVPPWAFAPVAGQLGQAGLTTGTGWRRLIVEKPFGTNWETARSLNASILTHWNESQIYRVDHYLGKEAVQNLLAFRFSNGMYEPLWNNRHIDHIQFNVAETVDVENRGAYYEGTGVLRDMIQNHMLQMLAYLCMEPPTSFDAEDVRGEKAKLLRAIRAWEPDEVPLNVVRGQYGPACDAAGNVIRPGYRQAAGVRPDSSTETYAACRLYIDNWRWEGVPIYLRSGKALWKRGTEVVVAFKKPPYPMFRGTPVERLSQNRLIFHIQPRQAIETLFHVKVPGPTLQLQTVHQRFDYAESFKAARATGYEVMLYSCMHGDATLFSRADLVDAAWRVAQPILDSWLSNPATEFPNYHRASWGPKAALDLIERDGRRWYEVITPEVLEACELFQGADAQFLNALILALRPAVFEAGETIARKGDPAREMYLICRGEVDVVDDTGKTLATLGDGGFFGEVALLLSAPRTATARARTGCDLFVLHRRDFDRILREQPQFAERISRIARERYKLVSVEK